MLQVMFLGEIEEIISMMKPKDFEVVLIPLLRQLARSMSSPHFQVQAYVFMCLNLVEG